MTRSWKSLQCVLCNEFQWNSTVLNWTSDWENYIDSFIRVIWMFLIQNVSCSVFHASLRSGIGWFFFSQFSYDLYGIKNEVSAVPSERALTSGGACLASCNPVNLFTLLRLRILTSRYTILVYCTSLCPSASQTGYDN